VKCENLYVGLTAYYINALVMCY